MSFTITGAIQSEVWLEYSTNGGTTWTRLPTSFPIGSSIVTNDLPTDIDLKVRLVAVCDETKISNVLDYDYVPSNCFRVNLTVSQIDLSDSIDDTIKFLYRDCNGVLQESIQNNAGNYTNVYCAQDVLGATYLGLDNQTKTAANSFADLTTTPC